MSSLNFIYTHDLIYDCEHLSHNIAIEALHDLAFGPARYCRAAHLIRRHGGHDLSLSLVALSNRDIQDRIVIGSVRMTPITIGNQAALMLGPLIVSPFYKNSGIGGQLMRRVLNLATEKGHQLVILVGDEPYYRRFGFQPISVHQIIMPAPVDPQRLLACELVPGCIHWAKGLVRHRHHCKNIL